MNKDFSKSFGFLLLITVLIFTILIYSIKISRNSWETKLVTSVQKVLEEKFPSEYTVGNFVELENPISSNAAVYQIKNNSSGEFAYAVIVRIATFYGPYSAVYIYENDESSFVGLCSLHGRIAQQFTDETSDKRIKYWKNKIPEILNK